MAGAIRTQFQADRFIPACAGNNLTIVPGLQPGSSPRVRGTYQVSQAVLPPVHPRVCGEHLSGIGLGWNSFRFIPACAGNMLLLVVGDCPSIKSVHPRVCGEHQRPYCQLTLWPVHPRVCGEHIGANSWSIALFLRFIPACAGNIVCRN